MTPEQAKMRIKEIEKAMLAADFWNDVEGAQKMIREMKELQSVIEGPIRFDKGNAIISILAGAGGDDAEDFVAILFRMYQGYAAKKAWSIIFLDENQNDHGGYRSITFEISGKGAYGRLKHEAGVHRLVRISPFNANAKRQTSFALVEVLPEVASNKEPLFKVADLQVRFAKAGGAGGQNVNKRETAVSVTHIPTGVSSVVSAERSQHANREKALDLLAAKLSAKREEQARSDKEGRSIAKTTANEWGSQIRSYVLHPYKLVKDHRTDYEEHDTDAVLSGNIDKFIDAMEKIAVS